MASNRYNYTWADALLAIDTTQEDKRKREELEKIEQDREDEAFWGKAAGMGLGTIFALLGGGPTGWTIGNKLGEYASDAIYDWEAQAEDLEIGKFNQSDAILRRKYLKKVADDQTKAQAVDLGKDLLWTYMAAGGKEGMSAAKEARAKGEDAKFWTTFGSSKEDPGGWSVGDLWKKDKSLGSAIDEIKQLKGAVAGKSAIDTAIDTAVDTTVKVADKVVGDGAESITDEQTCLDAGFHWRGGKQLPMCMDLTI